MNIFTGLFLVLLILKSLGAIAVSWWVVFSPLFVVAAFFIAAFVVSTIIIWRNK